MDDGFQVGSTARRPGEETPDQLFVGEMTPHNSERPWLAIRGVAPASVVVTAESVVVLARERP